MEENIVTHENLAVQYFVELKESRAENKQLRDRMEALEGIFRGKYVKYGVLCCVYVAKLWQTIVTALNLQGSPVFFI